MEREPHEAGLVRKGVAVEAQPLVAQVEVDPRRSSLGVGLVEHAAGVVEGQPAGNARYGVQVLDAGSRVVGPGRGRGVEGSRRTHKRYRCHDDVTLDEFVRQGVADRRLRHARPSEKNHRDDGRRPDSSAQRVTRGNHRTPPSPARRRKSRTNSSSRAIRSMCPQFAASGLAPASIRQASARGRHAWMA